VNDLLRPTLFQQALGAAFFNLPAPVRQLHAVRGSARYAGIASVERGRNPLARLCARIGGLPTMAQITENTGLFESALAKFRMSADDVIPLFNKRVDWDPKARILTDQYSPANLLNSR